MIPVLEYNFLYLEEKYRIGLEEEIQSLEQKSCKKELELEEIKLGIAEMAAELERVKSELWDIQSRYPQASATRKINEKITNEIDF